MKNILYCEDYISSRVYVTLNIKLKQTKIQLNFHQFFSDFISFRILIACFEIVFGNSEKKSLQFHE